MKPWLPFVQGPQFQLMRERTELCSCEKVGKLRRRRWHATRDLVTSDAGKDDAISLRNHACGELCRSLVGPTAGSRSRLESVALEFELEGFARADIDVATGPSALFFDLREIRALVPVGFGVVVVGDSVEPPSFGVSAGDDGVCDTNDGGRIHAAAEFGEYGTVRTQPSPHRLPENNSEVLFKFRISAVADLLLRIEIPILADRVLPCPYEYRCAWRDGMDPNVRSQVSRREQREAASDVFFFRLKAFSGK